MEQNAFDVFIEIPKGSDRRLHLRRHGYSGHDAKEILDLGPTKNVIPVNDGVMPIAYGFVMGTLQKDESRKNPDEMPDEVDVLLYSTSSFSVGEVVKDATPIAFITREDGDHKVVAADSTTRSRIRSWDDIPRGERDLFLRYFGYKSQISSVDGAKAASDYIRRNRQRDKT